MHTPESPNMGVIPSELSDRHASVPCMAIQAQHETHAQMLEPLAPHHLSLDSPATAWHAEIREVVENAIRTADRSMQSEIGASEIGTPCTRKLVFKLGNVPVVNQERAEWYIALGTAAHEWLATVFAMENMRLGFTRYLIEHQVVAGEIDGIELGGHLDIYDRVRHSITDWKNPGDRGMRRARQGPDATYKTQVMVYGLGCENAGLPVREVNIVSFPRLGTLRSINYWHAPYDRNVAVEAISRASILRKRAKQIGYAELAAIAETQSDYCEYCPWFDPATRTHELVYGRCPGSQEMITERELVHVPPKF